ncbi:MAG: DUF1501 domain-containing protein [Isosphaeraceae bacterium]
MMNQQPFFEQPALNLLRRNFIQAGACGFLGLNLPTLLAAKSQSGSAGRITGKPTSVIFIMMSGGLGQLDSFDMKPEAPEALRGEFKPIQTRTPGIAICEHLPMLADRMDRLAIVRSMSHPQGNHLEAMHRILTGHPSVPRGASDLDRVASRNDFPCYGAVVDYVRGPSGGVPNGVALPLKLIEGPLTWPGQDAGFLGPRHDPWQLRMPPSQPEASDDSIALPEGLGIDRLHRRQHLLNQTMPALPGDSFADQQESAMRLLGNGNVAKAIDLEREDPRLRDRYGRHSFGKSLLMARRLVEVGVPIVQATMGIVQNWDTHVGNFPRLKNDLLPPLDRAVSALIDDLSSRHMLDDTLVVLTSEFGRTPRISPLKPGDVPGRDHWPQVFSSVFAGGGVKGGQVIGKSDTMAAYPVTRSFGPPDLAATIYSALGIDTALELRDRLNRPLRLTNGDVISSLYTGDEI